MFRRLKLYLNYIISSLFFTWSIQVLILLLNHHVLLKPTQIQPMFFDLLLFFGPLWFIFIGIIVFIGEFFAERKFIIGFFRPPTLIYILTFTVFITNLVSYLNYEYYHNFFPPEVRTHFVRLILIHSFLIFIGTIFFFLKKNIRLWTQLFFFFILALNILFNYQSIRDIQPNPPQIFSQADLQVASPRHIKIILMDGISLDFILVYPGNPKLLNLEWIRENGVVGRLKTFSPNFELALLNTLLSGRSPSQHQSFSHSRFQFLDSDAEFEIFPRYIFFRNSAKFGLVTFYKKTQLQPSDFLQERYKSAGLKSFSLISPPLYPTYSEKSLKRNNEFLQFFPDIPWDEDPKIKILRRAFFLDDFMIRRIPNWPPNQFPYFILNLKGLESITSHFFHYSHPQSTSDLREEHFQKYRFIMEKYYQFYDTFIGKMIGTMGDDEMLIILGLYEAEPLPLWRRILLNYLSKKDIFVYKSNSSLGLVLMYEKKALKKKIFFNSISIYDIYPTLCYYAGFPLNRSLRGGVIREIFTDQFLIANPIITHSEQP